MIKQINNFKQLPISLHMGECWGGASSSLSNYENKQAYYLPDFTEIIWKLQ